MKIISSYAYQGRNIYCHRPVVKIVVDLENHYNTPTNKIPGFNEKLISLLPGLNKHCCSKGYEGGFSERLDEGTYLAHVLEHIALEIQNLLNYNVSFGKARQTDNERIYNVIYSYINDIAGLEAGKLAVDIINDLLENKIINFEERLEKIKKSCIEADLGTSTAAIVEEAKKRKIPVIRIGKGSLLQLGYGTKQKRIQATLTENSSCISVDIACNKTLAKEIMYEYGIPVPEGKVVKSEEEAVQYSESIGYPVAVKPNYGSHGIGVSINLRNAEEVRNAYKVAREYEETVLVEKFIEGNHYRLLVVGNKLVAASQRLAAHVIGNGVNTVKELIEIENENPLRGEGHEKPLTKIIIDKVVELHLKNQGITLDHIPSKGEVVYLRENDNLSTGGIAIDITDEVHPQNAYYATQAAKVIGLDVAGVDMTVSDISKPLAEAGGAIIEINAAPGIRMHHYPAKGQARNAAKAIVDMLCPEGENLSIPIVSVTGTNGKTTTTRMIAHIIRQKGFTVGMTTTSGVYINDECIKKGDNTGPASAKTVLMDKRVEYAVLETARGGIVNRGLGYDLADVGIVTNVTEDHLGIDGIYTLEDLAHVKSLVVEAVKDDGYAIINADDQYCVKMKSNIKSNIIYFSAKDDNPIVREHIMNGGIAVYSDEELVYISTEGNIMPLMRIADIPATMGGILTHNIYNSLAAAAGAYGIGMSLEDIRLGLGTFACDSVQNPGRFNIFDVNGIKVVIDYGHNIDGYRNVINALMKMNRNRLIGVIGVPGDRTDSSTIKIGEMCGASFDRIFIKEDKDKRGRAEGEIANLLKQGCLNANMNPKELFIELIEEVALERAILTASPGDIIAVFYEEYQPLIDVIERLKIELREQQLITA